MYLVFPLLESGNRKISSKPSHWLTKTYNEGKNMQKTRTILLLGLILALSAMACQIGGVQLENTSLIRTPGEIIEETRPINDVSGVVLAIQGHMVIEVGEEESLVIEGRR